MASRQSTSVSSAQLCAAVKGSFKPWVMNTPQYSVNESIKYQVPLTATQSANETRLVWASMRWGLSLSLSSTLCVLSPYLEGLMVERNVNTLQINGGRFEQNPATPGYSIA